MSNQQGHQHCVPGTTDRSPIDKRHARPCTRPAAQAETVSCRRQDLFPEDVAVPRAGRAPGSCEVDPAQRHRSSAVVRRQVGQGVAGSDLDGGRPGLAVQLGHGAHLSSCVSAKLSSTVSRRPTSARERPASATSNHTRSTKAACLTSPSRVVRDGTSRRRACSSVRPSSRPRTSTLLSFTNASVCSRSPVVSTCRPTARPQRDLRHPQPRTSGSRHRLRIVQRHWSGRTALRVSCPRCTRIVSSSGGGTEEWQ